MSKPDPDRWRELADQASKEQNAEKLMELAKQINEILDENHDSKRPKNKQSVRLGRLTFHFLPDRHQP